MRWRRALRVVTDELVDPPRILDPEELRGSDRRKPDVEVRCSGAIQEGRVVFEADRTRPVAILRQLQARQSLKVERSEFAGTADEKDALVGHCICEPAADNRIVDEPSEREIDTDRKKHRDHGKHWNLVVCGCREHQEKENHEAEPQPGERK